MGEEGGGAGQTGTVLPLVASGGTAAPPAGPSAPPLSDGFHLLPAQVPRCPAISWSK